MLEPPIEATELCDVCLVWVTCEIRNSPTCYMAHTICAVEDGVAVVLPGLGSCERITLENSDNIFLVRPDLPVPSNPLCSKPKPSWELSIRITAVVNDYGYVRFHDLERDATKPSMIFRRLRGSLEVSEVGWLIPTKRLQCHRGIVSSGDPARGMDLWGTGYEPTRQFA